MQQKLLLFSLLLCGFVLASCDTHVAEPEAPPGLTFTPLPEGGSLFGSGLAKSLQSAAHGCYISSPNVGAPEAERYRYDAFFIHFPQHIVDAATGRNRVLTIQLGSTTLYATGERVQPVYVREVRCVIPDTPEAFMLLKEQVTRFQQHVAAQWEGVPMPVRLPGTESEIGSLSKGSMCQIYQVQVTYCDEAPLAKGALAEAGCPEGTVKRVETEHWEVCTGGGGTSTPDPYDPYDPWAGGGPGGGGTGTEPGTCEQIALVGSLEEAQALGCYVPEDPSAIGWGKAAKLLNKIRKAVSAGENMDDVATWRKMLAEEWDSVAGCAIGLTTGSAVASEMINCALDLLVGFKGDDFIEFAKGLGKFDELLDLAWGTPMFRYLAESIGRLDDLINIAKRTPDGYQNFRIPSSSADAVFNSLERGIGVSRLPIFNGNTGVQSGWRIPAQGGSINYYWNDSSYGMPAIEIYPSPDPGISRFKIRFDFR